jgi:hypothetical protein
VRGLVAGACGAQGGRRRVTQRVRLRARAARARPRAPPCVGACSCGPAPCQARYPPTRPPPLPTPTPTLQHRYPTITWLWCTAHAIDLTFEDAFKIEWLQGAAADARQVGAKGVGMLAGLILGALVAAAYLGAGSTAHWSLARWRCKPSLPSSISPTPADCHLHQQPPCQPRCLEGHRGRQGALKAGRDVPCNLLHPHRAFGRGVAQAGPTGGK